MSHTSMPDIAPSHVHPPLVFALLAFALTCFMPVVLDDGDTFTHIAAGAWMLDHRAVLTRDPLSWTFAGHPWDAHEWLSEVLLAVACRAAGLTGVVLLTAAAMAVAFANLARHVGRWSGWTATMALTVAALACVMPSVLARPHLLALPLLEGWTAELLLARHDRRAPSWRIVPLMAAWANMHGGFAFGILLVLVFAVEATLERPDWRDRTTRLWWITAAGSVAAALLTPQGVDGLLFPIHLLTLSSLALIDEWQPVNFSTDIPFQAVLLALVATLGIGRVRLPVMRLLLLIALLRLSLLHARHTLLFGLVGALVLAEPVGRAFAAPPPDACRVQGQMRGEVRGRSLYWSALALVLAIRLAHPVAGGDRVDAPASAIAHLSPSLVGRPVLNSYQFGGYLAFKGIHPFIDGRAELFGSTFVSDFLAMSRSDPAPLRHGIERYNIGWAILAVQDPLTARFDTMPGWRRRYADPTAVVFVRNDQMPWPTR